MSHEDEQFRDTVVRDISNAMNYVGAYDALYKLLVDRHKVILHSEMENLACDLEEFIYNWTIVDDE
jgi:hypothetical protein